MGEAKRRGAPEQRAALARLRQKEKADERQAVSDFLNKGIELEAVVFENSEQIREQSKRNYLTEWLDARLTLLAVVKATLDTKNFVVGHTTEDIAHRLTLLMAFFQGTTVTETLISEGQYIKAAAVLKQDYEIIARFSELHAGTAKPGQTPQIKHLPEEVKKYYGELNKIAHPSNQDVLISLMRTLVSGERNAITYIPVYNKESSLGLYELHIWLLLMAVQEYLQLTVEMYSEEESRPVETMRMFFTAVSLLKAAGFIFGEQS